MTNYISFSLWGNNPIYNVGAIRNAQLCEQIYPNWKMILYYDESVPDDTLIKLKELGVTTIDMSHSDIHGSFWRFLAADLPDSKFVIFRDTDSRISDREKYAVINWIESGKTIHIMRDHPYHYCPAGSVPLSILAGMWGIKGNKVNMLDEIKNFNLSIDKTYGNDQSFLNIIHSKFINDKCTHDDLFEKIPFPVERKSGEFVGCRIDEYDNPIGNDHLIFLKNV